VTKLCKRDKVPTLPGAILVTGIWASMEEFTLDVENHRHALFRCQMTRKRQKSLISRLRAANI
jgi:hypothetical protein